MKDQNRNNSRNIFWFITLQVLIIILSVTVGYIGHQFIGGYRGEFGLLQQARDILLENTILEVPEAPLLEYGMIRGMLETMSDPHTQFVEPASHEVQSDELTGSYGGVGVQIERDQQSHWRVYPLPDSPAEDAGIQNGDRLLFVDRLEVTPEMEEVTIIAAIRGQIGEKINLTVDRNGVMLNFDIKRASIPLPSVTQYLLPDSPQIGMIQIHRIAGSTDDEIHTGIEDLQSQGAKAFILDLRDNGGGLVEAGVDITRLFLEEGEIIHRQFRNRDTDIFKVIKPGSFSDIPLVLLINGNTASSAEIVAGAIRANQRAIIIGSPTYGKTTIQYIFELEDMSSIHVTSGRWWIPGQPLPIEPDHLITDDPTGVEVLNTAISVLQAELD